ncbi:phosphoinositide-3-kinase-interacting protein 1-like isoform X2 [Brienomyrus brachyistius]|uniref:phosphoinositide-3-kinase-interacting protein 1-like isoform X2 n=1 Tax=Brienomyrus brachyistius TaxID=42636 RepID=UPI0020B1C892|nr:phosphoinositide-3-kinase-interacting protein 1-like isoform X2 [Brienomyrus brachyistius]
MRRFVLLCVAFASVTKGNQDCIRSNGADYRGEQQITLTGEKCLNWAHATRNYAATAGLDRHAGIGDHNFCRNPDSSMTPWCYVIGQDSLVQRQACVIEVCRDDTPGKVTAVVLPATFPSLSPTGAEILNPVHVLSTQGEPAAVRPAVGPARWIRTDPTRKKDLGIGGYVLGIITMTLIILLGMGITGGYIYNMGRGLRRQREQQEREQEMQRLALPLSAFSNPTCQLLDEVTTAPTSTSAEERAPAGGNDPHISQTGTPGA